MSLLFDGDTRVTSLREGLVQEGPVGLCREGGSFPKASSPVPLGGPPSYWEDWTMPVSWPVPRLDTETRLLHGASGCEGQMSPLFRGPWYLPPIESTAALPCERKGPHFGPSPSLAPPLSTSYHTWVPAPPRSAPVLQGSVALRGVNQGVGVPECPAWGGCCTVPRTWLGFPQVGEESVVGLG